MQKGVIVGKLPEKNIPDQLIEKLLKEFDGYFSFAVCDMEPTPARIEHMGSINDPSSPTKLENVKGILELAEDKMALFFFAKNDKPWIEQSQQPFVLHRNSEGHSQIIAFVEGDFPNYDDPGMDRSAESMFFELTVVPKFKGLMDKHNNDTTLVWADLDDAGLRQDFKNAFGERGSLEIISIEHGAYIFDKNDLKKEFEWGWMSNHCGYQEGSFPAKEEPAKPKSFLEAAKAILPGMKPSLPKPPKPVVPRVNAKEDKEQLLFPPSTLNSKDLKIWYKIRLKDNNNFPKGDWRTSKPPLIYEHVKAEYLPGGAKNPLKTMQDLPAAKDTSVAEVKPEVKKPQPLQKKSDTAPAHIPAKEADAEVVREKANPNDGDLPIITPEQKKRVKDSGILDLNAHLMKTPEQIMALEENFPTFTEAFGMKGLEDILNWDFQAYKRLGAVDSDSLALLALQIATSYYKKLRDETPKEEKQQAAEQPKATLKPPGMLKVRRSA